MKSVCGVLIYLLVAFTAISLANPLKEEKTISENEIPRDKRQMKPTTTGTTGTTEQGEGKFLGAPLLAAAGAIQAITHPLASMQTGRFANYGNGLMIQGSFGNLPSYGAGGLGGSLPINGLPGNVITPSGNTQLTGTLTTYPSGLDLYQNYMFGPGVYPPIGAPITPGLSNVGALPPLETAINLNNVQGLSTQLIAQPSQIQQQILPYPPMPGVYPQLGFGPGYQHFQG